MYSIQFWKHWQRPYQILFWFMTLCLLAALVLFGIGYFSWPAPVITLEHFQQVQSVETHSHSFSIGLINFSVPADSYLIFEHVFGSALTPNASASYFLLFALSVAFVFFTAIATTFKRVQFLVSMGVVIGFLMTLQLDALEIFGLTNRVPTVSLILIFGISAYYFQAIKTETSFITRLLVFSLLTVAAGILISYSSKISLPLLQLGANGLLTGIIACVIFILIVAHEIVAFIVVIATGSLKSERSLQHFLVLTGIYLVNVFMMFAIKMGFIEWNFFSISPFALLVVSAVLGIWGFRQREKARENSSDDEPVKLYLFLALALISFGTMSFFFSSASDMAIDAFEDLIVAAHFGAGVIFVFYVIANFGPKLVKNFPVYKTLYEPETMPFFTFRIMALMATWAVLSRPVSVKTYINQLKATYFNTQADVRLIKAEISEAEVLYQKGIQFRNQNMHAHYALASIYAAKSESPQEKKEYEKGIDRTPSVPLYLNLSQAYAGHGDLLEAALTLDEAKKKFPRSGEIQNAVGLSFLRLKQADSAFFFFQSAKGANSTKALAETNLVGAAALFNRDYKTDSVVSLSKASSEALEANKLALANLKNKTMAIDGKFSADTSLTVYEAMTLCNYLVGQKESVDTLLIRRVINLSRKDVNAAFAERLMISSAHALYSQGLVKEAMQIMRETAFNTNNPKYFSLIGLWLFEQGNPALAAIYFKAAGEKRQPNALYYQAIAETEADSLSRAVASWDSLRKSNDKNHAASAEKMLKVLKAKPDQVLSFSDDEKYFYCKYKIALNEKALFEKTINSIVNENIRSQAIIDRSKKWFALDEPVEAAAVLGLIASAQTRNINQQVLNLKLLMAAESGNWKFIEQNLSSAELPKNRKTYFEALLSAQSGNQQVTQQKFTYLIKADNQFEEGVAAAVRYFSAANADPLKNFSILVEGIVAKPNSVKLLKLHALMAAELGFPDAAQDSLNKLRRILPDALFRKFANAHPDHFGRSN